MSIPGRINEAVKVLIQVLEPVAVWTGMGRNNFPLKQDRVDVKSANPRDASPLTLDNIVLALKEEVCNLGDFLGHVAPAEGIIRKRF